MESLPYILIFLTGTVAVVGQINDLKSTTHRKKQIAWSIIIFTIGIVCFSVWIQHKNDSDHEKEVGNLNATIKKNTDIINGKISKTSGSVISSLEASAKKLTGDIKLADALLNDSINSVAKKISRLQNEAIDFATGRNNDPNIEVYILGGKMAEIRLFNSGRTNIPLLRIGIESIDFPVTEIVDDLKMKNISKIEGGVYKIDNLTFGDKSAIITTKEYKGTEQTRSITITVRTAWKYFSVDISWDVVGGVVQHSKNKYKVIYNHGFDLHKSLMVKYI